MHIMHDFRQKEKFSHLKFFFFLKESKKKVMKSKVLSHLLFGWVLNLYKIK